MTRQEKWFIGGGAVIGAVAALCWCYYSGMPQAYLGGVSGLLGGGIIGGKIWETFHPDQRTA